MGIVVKAAPALSIGSSKERRRNRTQNEEESSLLDTVEIDDLIGKVLDDLVEVKKPAANKKRSKKLQRKQYRKMKEEKCPNKDSDSDSQSTLPVSENSDNENDTAFSGVSKMTDFSKTDSSRLSMFSRVSTVSKSVSTVSKSTQVTSSSRLSRIMGKVGRAIPVGSKHRQVEKHQLSIAVSASSIFDFGDEKCNPERSEDGSEHTESTKTSNSSKQSDAIFQVASDGELDPIFLSGLDNESIDEVEAPPELRINLTDATSSLIDTDGEAAGQGDIPDEHKEQEITPEEPKEQEIIPDKHKEEEIIPDEPNEEEIIPDEPNEEEIIPEETASNAQNAEPKQVQYFDNLKKLAEKHQGPLVMKEKSISLKRKPVNFFEPSMRTKRKIVATNKNGLGTHRGRAKQAKPNEQESLIEEIGEILKTVTRDEDYLVDEIIEDVSDTFGSIRNTFGLCTEILLGALGDAVDVLGDIVDEF